MSSVLPVISQDTERKCRAISANWNDKRRRARVYRFARYGMERCTMHG